MSISGLSNSLSFSPISKTSQSSSDIFVDPIDNLLSTALISQNPAEHIRNELSILETDDKEPFIQLLVKLLKAFFGKGEETKAILVPLASAVFRPDSASPFSLQNALKMASELLFIHDNWPETLREFKDLSLEEMQTLSNTKTMEIIYGDSENLSAHAELLRERTVDLGLYFVLTQQPLLVSSLLLRPDGTLNIGIIPHLKKAMTRPSTEAPSSHNEKFIVEILSQIEEDIEVQHKIENLSEVPPKSSAERLVNATLQRPFDTPVTTFEARKVFVASLMTWWPQDTSHTCPAASTFLQAQEASVRLIIPSVIEAMYRSGLSRIVNGKNLFFLGIEKISPFISQFPYQHLSDLACVKDAIQEVCPSREKVQTILSTVDLSNGTIQQVLEALHHNSGGTNESLQKALLLLEAPFRNPVVSVLYNSIVSLARPPYPLYEKAPIDTTQHVLYTFILHTFRTIAEEHSLPAIEALLDTILSRDIRLSHEDVSLSHEELESALMKDHGEVCKGCGAPEKEHTHSSSENSACSHADIVLSKVKHIWSKKGLDHSNPLLRCLQALRYFYSPQNQWILYHQLDGGKLTKISSIEEFGLFLKKCLFWMCSQSCKESLQQIKAIPASLFAEVFTKLLKLPSTYMNILHKNSGKDIDNDWTFQVTDQGLTLHMEYTLGNALISSLYHNIAAKIPEGFDENQLPKIKIQGQDDTSIEGFLLSLHHLQESYGNHPCLSVRAGGMFDHQFRCLFTHESLGSCAKGVHITVQLLKTKALLLGQTFLSEHPQLKEMMAEHALDYIPHKEEEKKTLQDLYALGEGDGAVFEKYIYDLITYAETSRGTSLTNSERHDFFVLSYNCLIKQRLTKDEDLFIHFADTNWLSNDSNMLPTAIHFCLMYNFFTREWNICKTSERGDVLIEISSSEESMDIDGTPWVSGHIANAVHYRTALEETYKQ